MHPLLQAAQGDSQGAGLSTLQALPGAVLLGIAFVILLLGLAFIFVSRYVRCPANRILVISGRVGGTGAVMSLIATLLFGSVLFGASVQSKKSNIAENSVASRTVASFSCRDCEKQASEFRLTNDFATLSQIIGTDDRRKLTEDEEALFSGVGTIVCNNLATAKSVTVGTASVVGSRSSVVTVSHNLWNFGADGQRIRLDPLNDCVFRLVDRNNDVFFESKFVRYKTGKQFEDDTSYEHSDDWAVLRLERPAPPSVSYYGYTVLKQGLPPGKKYPVRFASFQKLRSDSVREKMTQDLCHFWVVENDSSDIQGREVHHDCDTLPSSSGGSLIYESADGTKMVVGIHSRQGEVQASRYNRAVKISDAIYSLIQDFSRDA